MTKIKAVLFDLDGTLIDTYQLVLKSHRFATREVLGRVIPDETLMATVGKPLRVQFAEYTDSPEVIEQLFDTYQEYNASIHDQEIRSFQGIGEMLEALRGAGLRTGVVTSKIHRTAEKDLGFFGFMDYMDALVGPDDCATSKPDPGPVLHGCELLGVRPEECLYVGDSPFDMQAGNAAGCTTVAVLWGMFGEEVLRAQAPDHVLATVAEFQDFVAGLA